MGSDEIKILLVEDDDDLRITLSDFISRMGVRVKTARDVQGALRIIQNDEIACSIVLTDLKLPGGTGMDVVKAAHGRAPGSLVTILTGYASLETAIEAIRAGAYDYITKPFSLEEIGVQVRNMIERVALSRENVRLSLRLQDVCRQLDTYRAERIEMLKYQERILDSLREATGKLDQLLQVNGPFQHHERLDKMKQASTPPALETGQQ
jgi:DNA-binding NtrC family response regulator